MFVGGACPSYGHALNSLISHRELSDAKVPGVWNHMTIGKNLKTGDLYMLPKIMGDIGGYWEDGVEVRE